MSLVERVAGHKRSAELLAQAIWGYSRPSGQMMVRGGVWITAPEGGGMIITSKRIAQEDRDLLSEFIMPHDAYVATDAEGQVMRAGLGEPLAVQRGWQVEHLEIFACDGEREWVVPFKLLDIGRHSDLVSAPRREQADLIFDRFFAPRSPEAVARRARELAFEQGDTDVIAAAVRRDNVHVMAFDHQGRSFVVTGYEHAHDQDGVKRLSLCEKVVPIHGHPSDGGAVRRISEASELAMS